MARQPIPRQPLPDWRDIEEGLDEADDFGPYGDVPAPRYGAAHLADDFLDEVLPEAVDWRRWVIEYPLPVLAVAAVGGFFLGRWRGRAVMAAAVAFGAERLARGLSETFQDDDES